MGEYIEHDYATWQPRKYGMYKYLKNLSINRNLYLKKQSFIREKWLSYCPKIALSEQF